MHSFVLGPQSDLFYGQFIVLSSFDGLLQCLCKSDSIFRVSWTAYHFLISFYVYYVWSCISLLLTFVLDLEFCYVKLICLYCAVHLSGIHR